MRGEGPLRYPGAKSNLAPLVASFLQRHRLVGLPLTEPFGGSAAVSRHLLRKRLIPSATIWEADPGAHAFWEAALNHTRELKELVAGATVTLGEFDRQSALLDALTGPADDPVAAGFAFLFLNRTSYSGIVGAGPIGGRKQSSAYPIDCRFNRDTLQQQLDLVGELRSTLVPKFGDGVVAIENARDDTTYYVDPPYFSNGKKFYRKHFRTLDHYRLQRALRKSPARWILSYDYDHKVEYLYRAFPRAQVTLYHSAKSSGEKRELLVSPLGFSGLGITDHQVEASRQPVIAP